MADKRKRVAITAAIIGMAAVLVALGVLYAVVDSFLWGVVFHVYVKILLLPIAVIICKKYLENEIPKNYKKVTALCTGLVFVDLVVVDIIRYVASGGVTTMLFLPFCLPAMFMVISFYSAKERGVDEKANGRLTGIVGIPLLLLATFFEIASFW